MAGFRARPSNLFSKLRDRETDWRAVRPNMRLTEARSFYTNVFPNHTLHDVQMPLGIMRKFSPDGHLLLSISRSQHSIKMYRFKGPAPAVDHITQANAFDAFFEPHFELSLTSSPEVIHKDFCLFTEGCKFMILASYAPSVNVPLEQPRNYDSLTCIANLEDVTFHLVDLTAGRVCDRRHFKSDYINLPHNTGVYLYQNTLGILSLQHQTIHIFQIKDSGHFVDLHRIGAFCYDDDELLLAHCREAYEGQQQQQQQQQQQASGMGSSAGGFQPPAGTTNGPAASTPGLIALQQQAAAAAAHQSAVI
eukprot:Opistho-2@50652